MKLTADKQGRISYREFFPPGRAFDATRQPDGSIRIVELVPKTTPKAKRVRRGNRTYLESPHPLTNADTEAVMSQFP